MVRRTVLWAAMGLCLLAWSGCGPKDVIQLRYERPAEYTIEPDIRSLGIAEFGGQTAEDRKWGDIASDRLAATLDEHNRKYNRYELVDRKRLKAILDEQDLQAAFSDSAQALQAGQIAHVDAMIYGSVSSSVRDETINGTTFDPLRREMRPTSHTRRYVMMAANFTIDNVKTGKTLATVSTVREFDSDKQNEGGVRSVGRFIGLSGGSAAPADQIAGRLIDECVQEFLRKICPHEVTSEETLHKGKSKIVKTGNTLAVAGDYAQALEMYQAATGDCPDDHEAMFNAGVVSEAMGHLEQAEQYYDKAFHLKPEPQYAMARKRVRQESEK